jgi:hypothetical protein
MVLAGLLTALAPSSSCLETRRSLGDDCLKDDDCLSRTCLQLHCAAAPPTTDARAAAEAATEASTEAPPDAGLDSAGTDD